MTAMSRLDMLKSMLEQDPDDEFSRYALALELKKIGKVEPALEHLGELIERHPDYVPAYFMSSQYFAELGRMEEAKKRLKKGIAIATKMHDHHARKEMVEYLESLEAS